MKTDTNELLRQAAPYSPTLQKFLEYWNPASITLILRPKSYRKVDYYWAYGEDAKTLANNTDLLLVHIDVEGLMIPAVGVPHYGVESYKKELATKGISATWVC